MRSRPLKALLLTFAVLLCGAAALFFLPWRTIPDESSRQRTLSKYPPLFTDVTDIAGLDFVHTPGDLERYFFPSIMGGGCALLDFDRDGLLDIYLVNGNDTPNGLPAADGSPEPPVNRLYRQTDGGRLLDVTDSSGLGDPGYGMGVAVGDVNNDGYPDVYITNFGPDRLYLNQKDGTFLDVTETAGIGNVLWSASASFLDYDRDGRLDLYVTNYVDYYAERNCPDPDGRPDFCGPQVFFETADKLFRNVTGDQSASAGVRFQDVSRSAGIASRSGAGLGIVCADFDGDTWCDIYVANDRTANLLWINQRDGTFVDEAVLRGAAYDPQGRAQAGMGIALADVNADALPDLYVTHLEGESNALYLSQQRGLFAESSAAAGLLVPTFPYTGFGTAFLDINHDAALDIVVANGRVKRSARSSAGPAWSDYAENNLIFLGEAGGRFAAWASERESFTATPGIWRGLAVGDVDRDGDLDLLVTSIAGQARLSRNDAPKSGGWLAVRAIDPHRGGRDACGAVVTVMAGDARWTRTIQPGFSYLSSSEPVAHFGTGPVERCDLIDVLWPDGTAETFPGGPVNQVRILEQGAGEPIDAPPGR